MFKSDCVSNVMYNINNIQSRFNGKSTNYGKYICSTAHKVDIIYTKWKWQKRIASSWPKHKIAAKLCVTFGFDIRQRKMRIDDMAAQTIRQLAFRRDWHGFEITFALDARNWRSQMCGKVFFLLVWRHFRCQLLGNVFLLCFNIVRFDLFSLLRRTWFCFTWSGFWFARTARRRSDTIHTVMFGFVARHLLILAIHGLLAPLCK